jgi:hypothetical protein
MSQLLIFVDSERSDTYLNSVVYNLRSASVTTVRFVHVYAFPGDTSPQAPSGLAKRTLTSILQALESLAQRAEYMQPDGTVVPLGSHNGSISSMDVRAFYQPADGRLLNYHSEEVHYGDLRQFIRGVRRTGGQHIIDVTGCRKRFFGDLIALGLVDGLEDIRTFDLLAPVNFNEPWRMLLHELSATSYKSFEYVDILETRIMIDCARAVVIRAPRLRYASMVALALAILGVALNAYFGLDSEQAKWVNVLAQFATFAGLFFVFFPPRNV